MKKKLRVLVLVHEDLVPPENVAALSPDERHEIKTEYDVMRTLGKLGHEVEVLGVSDELRPIRDAVEGWKPDVVFNLLEEFRELAQYDAYVASYLELLGVPYTGCNPRGLMIARDKALSKKLLVYHRIRTPLFAVARRGRKYRASKRLEYPLIVKSTSEEASFGISKASVVRDADQLHERIRLVHERVGTDALIEQFVEGRELYVGVLGNERLTVLPPQELEIEKRSRGEPLIATARVKHDPKYQDVHGVTIISVYEPEHLVRELERTAKRVYRTLGLDGYARIDFRLDEEGHPYVLEANPNPEIADGQEMAEAAKSVDIDYRALLQRILSLALRRRTLY